MKTKSDLRRMMLSHLTVIDATEDPDAEQARLADLWIDSGRAFLSELGLCWWDEDAIPDAVFMPLARYVGALGCASFGRAGKGYEGFENVARLQISALKSSPQREDVRGDYF